MVGSLPAGAGFRRTWARARGGRAVLRPAERNRRALGADVDPAQAELDDRRHVSGARGEGLSAHPRRQEPYQRGEPGLLASAAADVSRGTLLAPAAAPARARQIRARCAAGDRHRPRKTARLAGRGRRPAAVVVFVPFPYLHLPGALLAIAETAAARRGRAGEP